jgi:hypothetical protein
LALTTRKFVGVSICMLSPQSYPFKEITYLKADLRPIPGSAGENRLSNLPAYFQTRVQGRERVLKDHLTLKEAAPPFTGTQCVHSLATNVDSAARRILETHSYTAECRFSCAALAYDS